MHIRCLCMQESEREREREKEKESMGQRPIALNLFLSERRKTNLTKLRDKVKNSQNIHFSQKSKKSSTLAFLLLLILLGSNYCKNCEGKQP